MLTSLATRAVETSGVTETANFTIKANGKGFKVLIDGLYSDKIRAVIRELWTNAFDSHAMAGKLDTPFYTHLPTRFEPWFSVRDFGVSMDHDTVMRLYTTVFESSKEDTNDQVGKLGLGSKSPFAYTDTFTVTAWLNGEKRLYSAFIGKNYVPQIAFMSSEPSDEAQGIEVSFPVKDNDEYDFKFAAQRTAIGFDVLPESNTEILPAQRKVLFEGAGWKLFKDGAFGAHARQGCVVYPLDVKAISGLSAVHRDMLDGSILIDFPIGELEITASREGLGYDEPTVANIKARLTAIENEFRQRVETMTDACKTYCDMLKMQQELYNSQLPKCIRTIIQGMKWRGQRMTDTFGYSPKYWSTLYPGVSAKGYSNYTLGRYAKPEKQAMTGHFSISRLNTIFYIVSPGDHQKAIIPRIQLHRKSIKADANVVILYGFTTQALNRLFVALGRPDAASAHFINMTEVPKLPKGQTVSTKVRARRVDTRNADPADWETVDIAADKGGFYIPIARQKIVRGNNQDYGKYAFQAVLGNALNAGLISQKTPIYAIPASLSRYYENEENGWVNFFDWLAKKAFTVVTREAYVKAQQRNQILGEKSSTLLYFAEQLAAAGIKPTDGMLAETVSFYENYMEKKTTQNYDFALMLIQKLSEIPADWTWSQVLPPHSDAELKAQYPMLGAAVTAAANSDFNDEITQAALDYVNLIDSATNNN